MKNSAIFLCDVIPKQNEGIYKKVYAQAKEIAKKYGTCHFIAKSENGCYHSVISSENIKEIYETADIYNISNDVIRKENVQFIYVRHMLPSHRHICFIKFCKKKAIKLYYEIPTYPYFGEQIKSSTHKLRTLLRISLDAVTWPFIYQYLNKLIVIRSNSKVKIYQKMKLSVNGVVTNDISDNIHGITRGNEIHFAIVGTLYYYHGIDRFIKGMKEYQDRNGKYQVYLHIVGESPEIYKLRNIVEKHNIKNVYFHGYKSTDELNEMFNKIDVGIGCLALYRRNADIDTTLKIIEYMCRGIPVLTSGLLPVKRTELEKTAIFISNNNSVINIEEVCNTYIKISIDEKKKLSEIARKIFDWSFIMERNLQ
ncbi:glycosyltransferase [Mordavella massiliensis]|uniref:Glycosyltransferase n=1 Tax=Mordavella massiliensis TaxID=1871024 RepID=A0A938XD37_9CLOT|nr:glycosyltransferase [Mordavella massiliensis]MBM6948852.1 glycosyltransferase [Mordavella massiliensis]